MRFGLIAYPKKPLIFAHPGVSRETLCLKVFRSLLQFAYFVHAKSESLCVHAGSSEPSPHADIIRTIISCADQFIVLIFHCGPLFSFLIQYYNMNTIVPTKSDSHVIFCLQLLSI